MRGAGIDHSPDCVMPKILLIEGPGGHIRPGIGQHAVGWMAAANTGCFHGPAGRQIGRSKAHAVHAGARRGNRLDIVDPSAVSKSA